MKDRLEQFADRLVRVMHYNEETIDNALHNTRQSVLESLIYEALREAQVEELTWKTSQSK